MIELDISRRAQEYLSALTARGYDLFVPEDYARIPSLVLQTGLAHPSPVHAISRNDFTKGDAFWLFLTYRDAVVGGVAASHYDLRGDDFEDFLRRTAAQQYGRADPIRRIAPPVVDRLRGQLIYTGELHLRADFRGNLSVLEAFFRMLIALAALKWEFDHIYAIVPEEHRRLIEVYGFNWWMERAVEWRGAPPQGWSDTHYICAVSRPDFAYLWSNPSRFAGTDPER